MNETREEIIEHNQETVRRMEKENEKGEIVSAGLGFGLGWLLSSLFGKDE